jgi:hypothetical protein
MKTILIKGYDQKVELPDELTTEQLISVFRKMKELGANDENIMLVEYHFKVIQAFQDTGVMEKFDAGKMGGRYSQLLAKELIKYLNWHQEFDKEDEKK